MQSSEEIRRVVHRWLGIAFRESRDVELKGLDGSHRIYALDLG